MLLDLVLLLIGAATGFGAAFLLLWMRRREEPVVFELDVSALPMATRRFRVIMSTDNGAQARTLYERLDPKGDGVVDFLDGAECRGRKPLR